MLGLYKCNYSFTRGKELYIRPFEGNREAGVAPTENQSNTPGLYDIIFAFLDNMIFFYCLVIFSILFIYLFIYLFLKRGKGKEREGENHQCVVASCTLSTGDLAHNPGMCPDWESNQPPFRSQAGAQSTEPY